MTSCMKGLGVRKVRTSVLEEEKPHRQKPKEPRDDVSMIARMEKLGYL